MKAMARGKGTLECNKKIKWYFNSHYVIIICSLQVLNKAIGTQLALVTYFSKYYVKHTTN